MTPSFFDALKQSNTTLHIFFSQEYVGCKIDELTFEEFKTECEGRRELGIIRAILVIQLKSS